MINAPLTIRRIGTAQGFDSLKDEWNALLSKSSSNSFFLRWEWLRLWWETYKEDTHELCILLVYRGDELIGIAPLFIANIFWKNLRLLRRIMFLGNIRGSYVSEHLDFIYNTGDENAVILKTMRFIAEEGLCDDILLSKIDSTSGSIPILADVSDEKNYLYNIRSRMESPYISLPAAYDDFFEDLSPSMRYKLRRERRRLIKYPDACIIRASYDSGFEADFAEFVRLHQLRWESLKQPGSFSDRKFFDFQKKVMKEMLRSNHLELTFFTVGGRNIATLYNVRYKDKVCFYQAGLDASFDKNLSPGYLLHDHCIREAIKDGLGEYDFLLTGERNTYKKKWTRLSRSMCDVYMARPGILKISMSLKNKAKEYFHALKSK